MDLLLRGQGLECMMVLLGRLKALTAIGAEGHTWESAAHFELSHPATGLLPRRGRGAPFSARRAERDAS